MQTLASNQYTLKFSQLLNSLLVYRINPLHFVVIGVDINDVRLILEFMNLQFVPAATFTKFQQHFAIIQIE